MNEKFLKLYNELQRKEIQRVYDEIKWYVGESIHRDPSLSPEDKCLIEVKLAEILINGFGEYLSNLVYNEAQRQQTASLTQASSSCQ
jgi:hypothetical protein